MNLNLNLLSIVIILDGLMGASIFSKEYKSKNSLSFKSSKFEPDKILKYLPSSLTNFVF